MATEKQLYKVFIVMFAANLGISLFNAYHQHQERKLRMEAIGNGK